MGLKRSLSSIGRFPDDAVNVRQFGAKGDGIRDDTAAFLTAFGSNRTVVVPSGIYLVSSVAVSNLTNLKMLGIGNPTIQGSDTTKTILSFDGCTNLVIEGFKIGYRTAPTTRVNNIVPILVHYTTGVVVKDVEVLNSSSMGILLVQGNHARVEGCYVHDTKSDGIHAAGYGQDVKFLYNTVENTADDAIAVNYYNEYLPADVGDTTPRTKRVVVSGNVVKDSFSRGIVLGGTIGAVVTGNSIKNTRSVGITCHWEDPASPLIVHVLANYDFVVSNNVIVDAGQNGVDPNNSEFGIYIAHQHVRGVVTGNTIYNSKKYGMVVRGSANITGNVIDTTGQAGISMLNFEDPTQCYGQLTGNVFRNTGTMAIDCAGSRATTEGWTIAGNVFINCIADANAAANPQLMYFKFQGPVNLINNTVIESRATMASVVNLVKFEQNSGHQVKGTTIRAASGYTGATAVFITATAMVLDSVPSGTTANRPANPITGLPYFDTTLGKPIWYGGASWKDATGTVV